MQINLRREDLQAQFKEVNCGATSFEMFKPTAQKTVILAGRAVFRDDDRWNSYNAIYPPKATEAPAGEAATGGKG